MGEVIAAGLLVAGESRDGQRILERERGNGNGQSS